MKPPVMGKPGHRAGFVNILGNPNVGKSTLMNALVGKRISIITAKAQTTRHRILGILNGADFQLVLSDTPGIIRKPAYRMQEAMMDFVKSALVDADQILYVAETGEREVGDESLYKKLEHTDVPLLVLLNKMDQSDPRTVETQVAHWKARFPKAAILPIAARHRLNTDWVLQWVLAHLPQSPPFFPKDISSDKPERFFVNEIVREKILRRYKREVPYAVEVETRAFHETQSLIRIGTHIYVERETQRGILIGRAGTALKSVGVQARADLQKFFGKKIYLELYVAVNKDWRKKDDQLKRFGYTG
ncbi:MAG: GTPase Era [Flavobacteriales bacterium]